MLSLTDLDQRIWREELEHFVPARIFDVHTHLYRWSHYSAPDRDHGSYRRFLGEEFAESTWELADAYDRLLMPGRTVSRLSFGFPFPTHCDFDAANRFVAAQVQRDSASAGLMLVHPSMSAEQIERSVREGGFVGLKPYRFYASTGDAVECSITDFLPEHQIAVADRLGLAIMMHLSKRDAIADPDNRRDLLRLHEKYPRARWILAHCARGYSAWAIERAARELRDMPQVLFDTSSVCETDAFDALWSTVGFERVMYGSDDLPVGVVRGKYIAFGYAWAFLSESNHQLNLTHCDSRMTLVRYESLRAMRRAALKLGITDAQRELLFHDLAAQLVASIRSSLASTQVAP